MKTDSISCRKKCIWGLVNIAIPLLVGAIYYYVFCPDVIFVKRIDEFLNIRHHIFEINDFTIVRIIRFYLLDFIWAYALVNCIFLLLGSLNTLKALITSVIISVIMSIMMEMFQLVNIARGTFDILDIVVEILAIIVASIIIKTLYRRGNTNEEKVN